MFASRGVSEEDENLISLCTWCHLDGVHGGRIRAPPPASDIEWRLGDPTAPLMVIHGRELCWGPNVKHPA